MPNVTPEGKLLEIIKKDRFGIRLRKDLNIFTKVNILLGVLIAGIVVIFLADILFFKNKSIEPSDYTNLTDIKPLDVEMNLEPEMDIPDLSGKQPVKRVYADDIKKNFALLGIITGDSNQAIIEDKTIKKTFFLYKGDTIGDMKVEDIKNNMVILDCQGEKIQLSI
jgi:hypothetical protein